MQIRYTKLVKTITDYRVFPSPSRIGDLPLFNLRLPTMTRGCDSRGFHCRRLRPGASGLCLSSSSDSGGGHEIGAGGLVMRLD